VARTVKDEIIEHIDRMSVPQQQRVLDFARDLNGAEGTPGEELLRFAGAIDSDDLVTISRVIEDGCEKIEPNAW
jgi:hypothetical protein